MDINNYSYSPYMLDDSETNRDKTPVYDPRVIALDCLCALPGYDTATRETKNFMYDIIVKKVRGLCEGVRA